MEGLTGRQRGAPGPPMPRTMPPRSGPGTHGMDAPRHYDLVVIGGGPGGYVGAIRAAQLGMKTACVERDRLGGVCLNWGCIPSKALLHDAETYASAVTHGASWGLNFDGASMDWAALVERSRALTGTLGGGVGHLLKKNGVDHVEGHARITSGRTPHTPCTIEIRRPEGDYYDGTGGETTATLTTERVLIATGASPRPLPGTPFDGTVVLSSREAMVLPSRPGAMVIVGAGAIGMEFASFYNAFGTSVTVVEMEDQILPAEDDDVSKLAGRLFSARGIDCRTEATVTSIERRDGGATVTIAPASGDGEGTTLDVDVVLVAIGVQARTAAICDEGLALVVAHGHIVTDARTAETPTYATSVPGLHAIGDAIGPPWLAHVASEEAVTCVERLAGHVTMGVDYRAIPACTYTSPQVASIGLTEREAREQGLDLVVGTYPLRSHGKALAVAAESGLVKIVATKPHGEILGAHIIGEDASEMIAEMSLAIRLEATIEDVISTMHAHPTMAEAIHEAALAVEGRVIHG